MGNKKPDLPFEIRLIVSFISLAILYNGSMAVLEVFGEPGILSGFLIGAQCALSAALLNIAMGSNEEKK